MLSDLPEKLQAVIGTAHWETVSEGESDARVYRLCNQTVRYLKISSIATHYPVKADALRLQWLEGKIPVPQILHYEENDTYQYLLMTDCPGLHPLHNDLNCSVEERIRVLADATKDFHAIPIADCPYRMTFDEQIARAQHNIEGNHLRGNLREDLLRERNAEEIIAEFRALKPDAEDFVLTHGDMYPVNIRVDEASHAITGFIDVSTMAVADRYTDLAPIVNAIGWHHDKKWIAHFFDRYGIPLDEAKLRFYQAIHPFL